MGFFHTVKVLYSYLRPYRKRIAIGLITLLLVDVLNAFPPLVLKTFIDQAQDTFKGDRRFSPYFLLGALYLLIAIVQGLLRYLWRQMLVKSSHRAVEKIRDDYFRKLQTLTPSFYDVNPIGDLMSLATNDVEAVRFALGPGLLVFADAIFLFLAIPPAMIFLSPRLTLISLVPLFFVPFAMGWLEKQVYERFKKVQEQFSELTTFSQENIEGVRIIKAFVREWSQIKRFAQLGKEFILLNLKLGKVQGLIEPVFIIALNLGTVFLIYYAGPSVISGEVELGTFVAFTRYLDQLVWPLTAVGLAVTYYLRGKGSLYRILAVLNDQNSIDCRTDQSQSSVVTDKTTENLLSIDNLNFKYGKMTNETLKNVSFKIKKGEWVAFVGPIGSGKSTLCKIIAGHYPVGAKKIFWSGRDVIEMTLKERREKISIVPQELFLFSDTVGVNVELGAETTRQSISEGEIHKLLKESAFTDDLHDWNLDMQVGERGAYLSGGQRARLTLARAYARNAELLILDDALSSVDVKTESEIIRKLFQKRKDQHLSSLIMITHRFSGIMNFDRIIVFKKGMIIDEGKPSDLLKRDGLFKKLYELQKLEDELSV